MNIGNFFGKIVAQRLDDDVFGVEMSRVKDADAGCCGSQIFVLFDLRGQQGVGPRGDGGVQTVCAGTGTECDGVDGPRRGDKFDTGGVETGFDVGGKCFGGERLRQRADAAKPGTGLLV